MVEAHENFKDKPYATTPQLTELLRRAMRATNAAAAWPKGTSSGSAVTFCRWMSWTSSGVIRGGVGAGGSEDLRGHGSDTRDEVVADSIARLSLFERAVPAVTARANLAICLWVQPAG